MYMSVTNWAFTDCDWSLHNNVFHPPALHLQSRKPLWRDRQQIDITSRWRVFWWSAGGRIHYLDRPTIWQPGFPLFRRLWSLLNQFWSGQLEVRAIRNESSQTVCLWRHPGNITHCQLMPNDHIWRRFASPAFCKWIRCQEDLNSISLKETTRIPSYYMDENYPAWPEIQ